MALIRSGALRDFPFGELSPEDFHRLALHLLNRDPAINRVENYGAKGSDGGVDLIAEATDLSVRSGTRRGETLVQVKRVREFTASAAREEIARVRASGAYEDFEQYLLVTSAVPSAKAIDELRGGCRELGIHEVSVWEPSLLTAKLLEHPDLLEFFFGISDAASWLRGPATARRYAQARERVRREHPLVLVVGSRPEFDFSAEALAGGARSGDSLRWLIENGVVDTVVAHRSDFSLAVGDLLPLDRSERPPHGPALWQPPADAPLGDLISDLVQARSESTGRRPVLAILGCDESQAASIRAKNATAEPGSEDTDLLIFGLPGSGEARADSISAGGQAFLRSVHEAVAPDWLALHLTQIDFDQEFSFEDIVAGRSVEGGIARAGMWPREYDDLPDQGKPWEIKDLPGTGKTARALRVAFRLCPNATHYLDLAALPGVTAADLGRLILGLEGRDERSVLILDNAHASEEAVEQFLGLLKQRGHRGVQVIASLTMPFTSLDLLGGDEHRDLVNNQEWKERRAMLSRWCEERLDANTDLLFNARTEAANMWHFFYLLRGGAESLSGSLEAARKEGMADVVWYMVAAQNVFFRRSATVRNVFAGLTDCELWPLTVDAGTRGRWLIEKLDALLSSQRILAVGDGFTCRHQYEAFGVLRLSFDLDNQLTQAPPRAASIKLFAQAMPQILIPPALRVEPEKLDKHEVRSFGTLEVNTVLTRQSELEQAVGDDPRLQEAVDSGWAALLELVETWPVHPLYWLFTRGEFSLNLLRFSPFARLRKMPALTAVGSVSDAIDVEYLVKGLLAYDALPTVRYRAEIPRFRKDLEQHLELAEGYRIELEAHDDRRPQTKEAAPSEAASELATLGKLTKKLRDELAELRAVEAQPLLLPFKAEIGEEMRWTLDHSTTWLQHHSQRFAELAEQIDRREVLASMGEIGSARALLRAQLWLLSPSLGRDLFTMMPDAWREEVVHRVKESPQSYSALHLSAQHDFLAIFVAELAGASPEIAGWLASGRAAEVGERAHSVPGLGRRGEPARALSSAAPRQLPPEGAREI